MTVTAITRLAVSMLLGCGTRGDGVEDAGTLHDAGPVDAALSDAEGTDIDPRCRPVLDAVREAATTHGALGAGFSIVRGGEVVCTVPYGVEEGDVRVSEETLFRCSRTQTCRSRASRASR